MTTYVLGPVNGDINTLQYALKQLAFDETQDVLWFCGNVLGGNTGNLALLKLIKEMGKQAVVVLGTNELAFMAMVEVGISASTSLPFIDLLLSPDKEKWSRWLSQRPLLHHEAGVTMVHAGIPAEWSLSQARTYAIEAESSLAMGNRRTFFENVLADGPPRWHAKLRGWKRTRFIVNALTRMQFIDENGRVQYHASSDTDRPWYMQTEREIGGQVICAYAVRSEPDLPEQVLPLQWPEDKQVLKVLRLGHDTEMFSFLR